jgi:hypothetical protein
MIAKIFSTVVSTGSIVVQPDAEEDPNLIQCYHNGWLHGDKLSNTDHGKETVYVLPSPLHHWYVYGVEAVWLHSYYFIQMVLPLTLQSKLLPCFLQACSPTNEESAHCLTRSPRARSATPVSKRGQGSPAKSLPNHVQIWQTGRFRNRALQFGGLGSC